MISNFKRFFLTTAISLCACLTGFSLPGDSTVMSSIVSIEIPSVKHLELFYALRNTTLSAINSRSTVVQLVVGGKDASKIYAVYIADSNVEIPTSEQLVAYTDADLGALAIPEKYRKIINGRIVEMSAAEKAQVDSK